MDILETVLRTARAEEYIEKFRHYGVDASVLPLLSDEDIKIIGVEDERVRKLIIKQSSNLQIPSEKKIDLTVSNSYALLVLHQISEQLKLHQANLFCAAARNDVVCCDVKLHPATHYLLNCISSMERQVNFLDRKLIPHKKAKRKKWKEALCLVIVSSMTFFICRKLIYRLPL